MRPFPLLALVAVIVVEVVLFVDCFTLRFLCEAS